MKLLLGIIITLFVTSGCLGNMAIAKDEEQKTIVPPALVLRFVKWLPQDTETIAVLQKPFKLVERDKDGVLSENGRLVFRLAMLPLHFSGGIEANLMVHGAKDFEVNEQTGLIRFRGCSIIQVEKSASKQLLEEDIKRVSTSKTFTTQGHDIVECNSSYVDGAGEERPNKIFICHIERDLFIIATDLETMKTVITRSQEHEPKIAIAESCPEWKQVDTTSDFWCIRHYNMNSKLFDPSLPKQLLGYSGYYRDLQPVGVCIFYNYTSDQIYHIRFISNDPTSLLIRQLNWKDDCLSIAMPPMQTRRIRSNVLEITVFNRLLKENQPNTIQCAVLSAMGHTSDLRVYW